MTDANTNVNGRPMPANLPASLPEHPNPRFDVGGRPSVDPGVDSATQAAGESFALAPAATAAQYRSPGPVGDAASPFDTNARGWLEAAGMPREVGGSLLSMMHKAEHARGKDPMPAAQLELSARSTEATLQRMWKGDYQTNVDLAQQLAHHIESQRPGFLKWLGETGLGNDALFISQFVHQARVLKARGIV